MTLVVQKTLHFFSQLQTVLLRELDKLLTCATQPDLVSPDCVDQAQWYHPARLSSESGESLLRHVCCYAAERVRGSRP